MRLFALCSTAAALALFGVGTSALARRAPSSAHWEMIGGLDDAFAHTANLRSGAGVCRAGHARRPGLPTAFHASLESRADGGKALRFFRDDMAGLWSLETANGERFFADAGKKQPAGHLLVLKDAGTTKTDVAYLAGVYAGTSFKSRVSESAGTLEASGRLPRDGAYSVAGCWNAANVGVWTQNWQGESGRHEKDEYRTFADGTARLQVVASNLEMDLAFAPDRSGQGAVVAKSGLTGKIEWEPQGDGTIAWADGSTQAFENWKL